ncbi:hypothetical protein UAM5_00059 [Ralstonia phage UAM5]|nr:hypothetical protein UAM5_00059 [Ralstonia phage UAM5]
MSNIAIGSTEIRQDGDGRYCLNDLHRSAGGEKRHGPSYWLSNATTRELIGELGTTGNPVVALEGAAGGTYVCKELVYAYAMWISPTFHLKVIRTFDAVQHQSALVPARQLSVAEMFLQNAQMMVDMERRQAEQGRAIQALQVKVQEQAEATQVLSACPANAESITRIRRRIFQQYGLPADVCDFALYHLPYSPRPAGMVRNNHEEANGATYAVWWLKDVSTLFRRFVCECTRITPAFVTHPSVENRFRLSPGAEG